MGRLCGLQQKHVEAQEAPGPVFVEDAQKHAIFSEREAVNQIFPFKLKT